VQGLLSSAGLVANLARQDAISLARDILGILEARGLSVWLEEGLARALGRDELSRPVSSMAVDILIVMGGDGTILRTCLSLPERSDPLILAVNMGKRGFLAEVEPGEAIEALRACLSGVAQVEERMRLSVEADGRELPSALNEVCLTSGVPVKLFGAHVRRNGEPLAYVEGDGLIIATPRGSTAYSLSCGGPVVDPGLRCILITPICPIRPGWPFVLPPDAEVEVEVVRAREPVAVVDGQAISELSVGSVVKARASDKPLRFVKLKSRFYEKLASRGK